MQAPDPLERLRDEAVAAFEPFIDPNAASLATVLRKSVEYGVVDEARSQLRVERRALLLALVAVGFETIHQYANMATWFADWLDTRLPDLDLGSLCAGSRTPGVEEAAGNGFTLVISESVRGARGQAVEVAGKTVNSDKFSLRHLFYALMMQPKHVLEIKEFGWSATAADIADLRKLMLERIGSDPAFGEDMEAWRTLLHQGPAEPTPPPPPKPHHGPTEVESPFTPPDEIPDERIVTPIETPTPPHRASPAYFVTGFAADRTLTDESEEATDTDEAKAQKALNAKYADPLRTEADVRAMAQLICHEDADPPISVGIFGGWGSGKSTFMEALQAEVSDLTSPKKRSAQPVDGPKFVGPIVQIRFNAWQFADANLWASLTAEFFDQLRAGGYKGGGARIHAKLIEDVNEHVRGLGEEAAKRRAAVTQAEVRLHEAQREHDKAVREQADKAVSEEKKGIRQALISGFAEAYEMNRDDLARHGFIQAKESQQLAEFISVAKDVRSQWGQVKRLWKMLGKQVPLLIGVVMAVLFLGALAVYFTRRIEPVALTAIFTGIAGLTPAIRRGLTVLQAVARQTKPFAARIDEAEKAGLQSVLNKEVELREAAAEAEALRAVSERADRALARYVDHSARSNPPKVLRYLLEDDPNTKAFEQEIGLIGRARRLFQALNEIVIENRREQKRTGAAATSAAQRPADGGGANAARKAGADEAGETGKEIEAVGEGRDVGTEPDAGAVEAETGLIGRARRLFQTINPFAGGNLVTHRTAVPDGAPAKPGGGDQREAVEGGDWAVNGRSDAAGEAAGPALALGDDTISAGTEAVAKADEAVEPELQQEIPARIILYIDDLDRCTHEQVYKVLQAVHLLLAFELFIVVAAVDMAWVEAAVAKSIEFAGAESEADNLKEATRRQRAVEYLSKIFQLPFWLRPFAGREDDERYRNYVKSLIRATEETTSQATASTSIGAQREQADQDRKPETLPPADPHKVGALKKEEIDPDRIEDEPPTATDPDNDRAPADNDPGTVERALKRLQLEWQEQEFLAGPEISALAATDPRGVKRLINVYKIARARLSETDDAMIIGDAHRAPAYPLIALSAAIETGQPLEIADYFYVALKRAAANRAALIKESPNKVLPPDHLRDIEGAPKIQAAVAAAVKARGDREIPIEEAFEVARVVRRYSFNKCH